MTPRARRLDAVTAGAGVLTVAAMVATPLLPKGGVARRVLSNVVVGGLFVTTTARSARRWGAARASVAVAGTALGTGLIERVGTRTGAPFGRYQYTGVLRPTVGGVPAIVPLAWCAMAIPAREAAHAALGHRSNRVGRVVLGAVALTAWDLFLDPQMVGEGYWRWAYRGRYRGIPLTNYAGWLLTSLGVMTLLEMALPLDAAGAANGVVADPVLVGEYVGMTALETVGFAAFFGDPVVAAVGGAAAAPIVVGALRTLRSQGRLQRRWRHG